MKKNIFYILMFVALATSAQTNHIVISWSSPANFQKLILPGSKHVFIQKCEPKADSIVSNGQLQFFNAGLKNISKCRVIFMTKDTILISSEIKTFTKKSALELDTFLSELIPDYKTPFLNYTIDKINYRTWFATIEGKKYIIKYNGKINKKKSSVVFMPDFQK